MHIIASENDELESQDEDTGAVSSYCLDVVPSASNHCSAGIVEKIVEPLRVFK